MRAYLAARHWIVLALAVVVLAVVLNRRRLTLWVGSITLTVLIALTIFPLGDLLLRPVDRTYQAEPSLGQVNGIIFLGGGEDARASAFWGQMQLNEGGERYTAVSDPRLKASALSERS